MSNMLAAVLMLKNEESSIGPTLDSIRDYIKHIVVFDTGSTDKTIEIIKRVCAKNKQILYLKQGGFTNFAVSRNEALDFAEEKLRKSDIEFYLLLDAGDEFRTKGTKLQVLSILRRISNRHKFGIVMKQWLTESGMIDHYDVRMVRAGCRYNLKYPVHETLAGRTAENMILLNDLFVLYQNRIVHGVSSTARFAKDIQMLLEAPPAQRNYYHLAQSYVDSGDHENGYKYYMLALEMCVPNDLDGFEAILILSRILMCAIGLNKDFDIVYDHFKRILDINDNYIDAYIYFFKYCIDSDNHEKARPYLSKLANMDYPLNKTTHTSHNFYSYLRWHLISTICLKIGDNEMGRTACLKACAADSVIDKIHLQLFDNRIRLNAE